MNVCFTHKSPPSRTPMVALNRLSWHFFLKQRFRYLLAHMQEKWQPVLKETNFVTDTKNQPFQTLYFWAKGENICMDYTPMKAKTKMKEKQGRIPITDTYIHALYKAASHEVSNVWIKLKITIYLSPFIQ